MVKRRLDQTVNFQSLAFSDLVARSKRLGPIRESASQAGKFSEKKYFSNISRRRISICRCTLSMMCLLEILAGVSERAFSHCDQRRYNQERTVKRVGDGYRGSTTTIRDLSESRRQLAGELGRSAFRFRRLARKIFTFRRRTAKTDRSCRTSREPLYLSDFEDKALRACANKAYSVLTWAGRQLGKLAIPILWTQLQKRTYILCRVK